MAKLKAALAKGGFLHWYPSEINTSIRRGWFWRDERQGVLSGSSGKKKYYWHSQFANREE